MGYWSKYLSSRRGIDSTNGMSRDRRGSPPFPIWFGPALHTTLQQCRVDRWNRSPTDSKDIYHTILYTYIDLLVQKGLCHALLTLLNDLVASGFLRGRYVVRSSFPVSNPIPRLFYLFNINGTLYYYFISNSFICCRSLHAVMWPQAIRPDPAKYIWYPAGYG